ncbi:MAG: DUF302 domain-containing protein [Acidobacteriota bacterium]
MRQPKHTIKIFVSFVFAAAFAIAGISLSATAPSGPVVQVQVPGTVSQTVTHLRRMVSHNGMMVMSELHQGKVLAMTGLHVQSETLFVGNPTVGKKLFSANPGVGLVVPVRVNIFKDANGKTVVSYIPPSKLLQSYGNKKVDRVAMMLDQKLHNMVTMLSR